MAEYIVHIEDYAIDEDGKFVGYIRKQPELIRCNDCKHWNNGYCTGIPFSGDDASCIETNENDYCSYAENKISLETGRLIEIINSNLSNELCNGCGIYGKLDCGCDECLQIASKQMTEMLTEWQRGKKNETQS